VATAFTVAAGSYALFRTLANSERGRQALSGADVRMFALTQISSAKLFMTWAVQTLEEAVGVTTTMILMAEASFVISHRDPESTTNVVPDPAALRELLQQTDGLAWLQHQGAVLPEWLLNAEASR
jgi:hypothetical protein